MISASSAQDWHVRPLVKAAHGRAYITLQRQAGM